MVDSNNTHIVFDDSLSDCTKPGWGASHHYLRFQFEEFKIALPCHPDLTPAGYERLDEVDERDSMWLFFQSQLPVPITWGGSSYGPA